MAHSKGSRAPSSPPTDVPFMLPSSSAHEAPLAVSGDAALLLASPTLAAMGLTYTRPRAALTAPMLRELLPLLARRGCAALATTRGHVRGGGDDQCVGPTT